MAKIQYGDLGFPEVLPYQGTLEIEINEKRTKAVYTDDESQAQIVLTGEGLKATSDDYLKAGTVDGIVLRDAEKTAFLTIDGDYKATDLMDALVEGGTQGLVEFLFAGKDTIDGSKIGDQLFGYAGKDTIDGGNGSDTLFGGKGDDTLTGGKKSDYFIFNPADGKGDDVITDFTTTGENIDYLGLQEMEIVKISKAHQEHDTLLTLDNGATILLEGVTKAEYQDYNVEF